MNHLVRLFPRPFMGAALLAAIILFCPVIVGAIILAALLRDLPGITRVMSPWRAVAARLCSWGRYEAVQQEHPIQI